MLLVSWLFPVPFLFDVISYDSQHGQGFGRRHGQPYTVRAGDARHDEEAGHQQHETAHEGERRGRPYALYALEIAYGRKVEDEEQEARREIGEAIYGYARGPVVKAYEQTSPRPKLKLIIGCADCAMALPTMKIKGV